MPKKKDDEFYKAFIHYVTSPERLEEAFKERPEVKANYEKMVLLTRHLIEELRLAGVRVVDTHDLMTLLRSRVTPDDIHIGKIITSWLLRIPNRVAVDALLHLLEALKYRQCGEELKKLFYMFDDLEDFGKPQYREARRTLFRAHIMGLIVRTRQPGLQDWLEKVAMAGSPMACHGNDCLLY